MKTATDRPHTARVITGRARNVRVESALPQRPDMPATSRAQGRETIDVRMLAKPLFSLYFQAPATKPACHTDQAILQQ
jgi:hypothetical protein